MRPISLYLVCYDIKDPKRLYRVRKTAYAFAFGGQKSAVESCLSAKELSQLTRRLLINIDIEADRVNIVKVHKKAILLGKAKQLPFDKGTIIL